MMVARRTYAVRDPNPGMLASSKAPAQDRPTHYTAPGLQEAREAANMTVEEVAEISGYSPAIVRAMESGQAFHTMTISRVAGVIPGHDLRLIRGEEEAGIGVTRASTGDVLIPGEA